MTPESREIEQLRRYLREAGRRRWWIILILTGALILSVAAFRWLPRTYASSTIISVERERIINPLTRPDTRSGRSEELLNTLEQQIKSRYHVEKVIGRLGLEQTGADPREHEELVRDILEAIAIKLYKAESFQVSFRGRDPYKVRDITNTLAGIFIEESLAFKEGEAGTAYTFLREQLEVYRKKMEESELALRQFEERHVDAMPEARTSNQTRLDFLLDSLGTTRQTMHQVKSQKELLLAQLSEPATSPMEPGQVLVPNPLGATLAAKEEELGRLRLRYSDRYPDVIRLKGEIETLREAVAREPQVPASQVPRVESAGMRQTVLDQVQKLDLEYESLRARETQLDRDIAVFQKRVATVPQVEQELARLKRDYDVNADIYNMFLHKVEEARVSRELEGSRKREVFRILDPAVLPIIPYSPTRLGVGLVGLAVGLALCFGLIYVLVLRDTSFRSVSEVRRYLDLKVLAGIPWEEQPRPPLRTALGHAAYGFACAAWAVALTIFIFWEPILTYLKELRHG